MSQREDVIAHIVATQRALQRLLANDRASPLFSLHLTLPQLKSLMLLAVNGSASGQELSAALGVSLATTTGIVDRLVAQGLVTRGEDPLDRRVRRVELSPRGRDLMDRIVTAGTEHLQRILSRLSDADLRTIARAGDLIADALVAERTEAGTDAQPAVR